MIYNGKHSMKTRRKDALRSATPRAQAVLETRNIRACRSVLSICEPQVCAHTACPRGATVHRPACHRKVPSPTHNLPSGMPATPLNGTVALHQSTSSPAEPAHNRRPTHRAPPPHRLAETDFRVHHKVSKSPDPTAPLTGFPSCPAMCCLLIPFRMEKHNIGKLYLLLAPLTVPGWCASHQRQEKEKKICALPCLNHRKQPPRQQPAKKHRCKHFHRAGERSKGNGKQ